MTDGTLPAPTSISEPARERLGRAMPELDYPAAGDVDAWLALVDDANRSTVQRFTGQDAEVDVEQLDVDGVTVYAARPPDVADHGPLYLWMHPGGFLVGGGEACRATTRRTAATVGVRTWGVDYGLPPLRPFPAGLEDSLTVYRAALRAHDPSQLVVGGTSSGGNLAAALVLRVRDGGLPMPAALVLNTPAVDLTESGDTFRTLADLDVGRRSAPEVRDLYTAGADPSGPYVSPLFGDMSGFPPTFLQSGTRDTLLSNTVLMHRALRAAGVDAELHVFEAMPHGGFGGNTPEDLDLAAEQRRFLATHTARRS